uniref:Uncharacterized protein n=1 Tax=Arion vulgaris TaxID=1028688 RepID=A0A0B7AEI6_9EUPU
MRPGHLSFLILSNWTVNYRNVSLVPNRMSFNEAINLVRVEVDFVQNDVILGNPSNSDDNSLKSSKC